MSTDLDAIPWNIRWTLLPQKYHSHAVWLHSSSTSSTGYSRRLCQGPSNSVPSTLRLNTHGRWVRPVTIFGLNCFTCKIQDNISRKNNLYDPENNIYSYWQAQKHLVFFLLYISLPPLPRSFCNFRSHATCTVCTITIEWIGLSSYLPSPDLLVSC